MEHLEGKTAVVTGSGSGLGKAIATRLAAEGMTVVIADNRLDAAAAAAAEIGRLGGRAVPMEVDVTKRASVEALAARVDAELGGADVLVNNAGVVANTPIDEANDTDWRWIVDVNLFGVVIGVQTFLPRMIAKGAEAHIVNVASLAGTVGGGGLQGNHHPGGDRAPEMVGAMYGYMATKHAVVAVTETMARDLAGSRIGASVLCPSHHEDTGIFDNSAQFRPSDAGGPMDRAEIDRAFGKTDELRTESLGRSANAAQKFPDECAARVVRAIRERQFYIFTHPDTRAAVQHRFAGLMAGFDDADSFSER
jgi:NAD(P)-dependent dehydrogenase (short-subunit alcohol dehydrogenase family)